MAMYNNCKNIFYAKEGTGQDGDKAISSGDVHVDLLTTGALSESFLKEFTVRKSCSILKKID